MRRVRSLFNLTLFIVPPVLVAGGATILVRRIWTYLNGDARLAGLISVEASRALGREVRVGDIKFQRGPWSLLPNRVELDDISIAQYPTLNSALFAHADKVIVWYDLNQILFAKDPKTPLVREVQIVGPQVTLSRDAQGRWNFEQIFKPTGQTGRPFTDKLSFLNASLVYSDLRFPHPAAVPSRPFLTRLSNVSGLVLVRPDKSVAFDVTGRPDPALLRDFHITGIGGLNPARVNARLIASRVNLPAFAERLIPANRARLQSGEADIDVSALYAPPRDTPLGAIDVNALDAHGTLAADNVNLTAQQLQEPLHNANVRGTFTTDSFAGSLRAQYAGTNVSMEGQAIGLLRRESDGKGKTRTVLALPTVSLSGRADQADVARLVRVLGLDLRLAQFPSIKPNVRERIVATTGHIRNVDFQIAGALNNPTVATSLHVDTARSFGFNAQNADARVLLDNRVVTGDVRGQAAGGNIAIRTRVLTQEPGTFDVEAHGRRVPLTALRSLVKRDITGTASLDLALRGRRGQTPFISAQAQADNVRLSGQSIQSVYARAATLGRNLIVRQVRLDDPKGFALLTGSIDLRTQQLKLQAAADNIDLHALVAAVKTGQTKVSGAAGQGTSAASVAANASAANTPARTSAANNLVSGAAANRTSRRSLPIVNGTASPAAAKSLATTLAVPLFDLSATQGQGFFRGRVDGTLHDPEVSGRISAFGIQAGQASLDRVITDFSLSRKALVIAHGTLERYPGLAAFSGQATDLLSGNPEVRLQATATNIDIPDALRLAGLQGRILPGPQASNAPAFPLDRYVVLGSLSSGPILLQGRLKSLRLAQPVTIKGDGVNINGLPVTNLSATATLDDGTLKLQEARADVAGGSITASGTLANIADKLDARLNADVQITGIDATRLSDVLPPDLLPLNVEGTLNLTAHAQGALRDLDATASLDAKKIALSDDQGGVIEIGDVTAQAGYAAGKIRLNSAVVSEAGAAPGTTGRVTLTDFAYDPKSRALSGVARWNELRFQRLRDLFNKSPLALRGSGLKIADTLKQLRLPITGSISGQANLSGTLDDPSADVSWSTTGLQIEDHLITVFDGSVRAGKKSVLVPSPAFADRIIRLQSDDIDIDIPTLSAVFGGGALSADVRANKLNLEFAHHFLPAPAAKSADPNAPAPTTQEKALSSLQNLTGGGTAEIVASGTTASPILEASINLRNVGVHDPLSNADQVISRIDVSHMTVQEGKIDTDIIEVSKAGTDALGQPAKFEANARGSVDFSWKPVFAGQSPFIQKDAAFDVTANVPEQSLSTLTLFGQSLGITSDGRFALRAHIFNTLDDPRVFGALNLIANRLQLGTAQTGLYRTGLRDVQGQIDFRNDSIAIHDGFTARTQVFGVDGKEDPKQMGAPISLTGSLPLKGNVVEGIRLRSDKVVFNETPVSRSRVNGLTSNLLRAAAAKGQAAINLNVSGSLSDPTLGGMVTLSDTTVSPPSDYGGGGGGSSSFPINPNFDLLLRLDKNVRAQNSALNAVVQGNLTIKGRLYADALNAAPPTPTDPATTLNTANGVAAATSRPRKLGLNVLGKLTIPEGRLTLPTARFTILPPGQITVAYPSPDASAGGLPTLGVDVDLKARTYLTATSLSGTRKRYAVTVTARGPLSGATLDPSTGDARMALNFTTDPNDLATSQGGLQQRLAGVLGGDALGQFGRNPGQVLAQQLTNVFTSAVIPSVFDNFARAAGFEEFSVNYDPVQRLNLLISRQIVGPFYVTYNRTLGSTVEMYDLKLSLRFKERYQLSYEQNETHEQRTLLEGVFRF